MHRLSVMWTWTKWSIRNAPIKETKAVDRKEKEWVLGSRTTRVKVMIPRLQLVLKLYSLAILLLKLVDLTHPFFLISPSVWKLPPCPAIHRVLVLHESCSQLSCSQHQISWIWRRIAKNFHQKMDKYNSAQYGETSYVAWINRIHLVQ